MVKNNGKSAGRVLAALTLAAILLCAGCVQQNEDTPPVVSQTEAVQPMEVEYAFTEGYMRLSEPYGSNFIISGKTAQTVIDGRTYVFPASVGEEARAQFITAQRELCAFLEGKGIRTDGFTFYVISDYTNRTESDNAAAFFDLDRCGSWEQALTTLQASLGDYTNYGYLYALADHVSAQLGWTRDELSSVTATGFTYRAKLLNLVYPCFDEFYTSAKNVERCKALAMELLAGMDDPFAGEEAFVGAIEEHAAVNDIDFTATHLRFAYNGASCPLKMLTRRMEVFRDSSYDAGSMYKMGIMEEDPMATVDGLVTIFEKLDSRLDTISEMLWVEDAPVIEVQMIYPLPDNLAGVYFENGGLYVPYTAAPMIHSSTVSVLAHEYTHYLYDLASVAGDGEPAGGYYDPAYEGWMNEAVAYYYTLEEDFELRRLQAESGVGYSPELMGQLIGQPYDEPSDEILFIRAALLDADNPYPYYLKSTNKACSAFGEYFVRTYGEEAFVGCMLYPSCAEAFIGVSVDQVVDDWCEDMALGVVPPEAQ